MQVLDTGLSNTSGNEYRTNVEGQLWFDIAGTFGGSTALVLQYKQEGGSYTTFAPDGVAQSFSAVGTHVYSVPGGLYFRFLSADSGDSLNIRVNGHGKIV